MVTKQDKSKFSTKFGCRFCNLEKIEIDKSDKTVTLSKKRDKPNKCFHCQKLILSKVKHT